MHKSRLMRYFAIFALLTALVGSMVIGPVAAVFAQDEPASDLQLISRFPEIQGNSGDKFDFEVTLRWSGDAGQRFELELIEELPEWTGEVLGGYPQKRIFAIGLEPSSMGETVTVSLAPITGVMPEPGKYTVTLVATAGDIRETVDLTAVVVAKYLFAFYTTNGRLNTQVTAGTDNHFGLRVQNTGSSPVKQIDFVSAKPEGWTIEFVPDTVDQIDPGYAREIDLVITPPRQVVPGDYMLELKTIGQEVGQRTINLRVTVLTPTVWGWVGVLIVVLVLAGLVFMFRQLGRR